MSCPYAADISNQVPSRFLYFPDENHWVLKAHNSRRWHKEVLGWLDQWVGHGKQ